MPATYTTSLKLTKPADGDTNWGTTVNTGITDLVDAAIAATASITVGGSDYTLTSNSGAADEARKMFIVATGTPGATRKVICPAVSKLYIFRNDTNQTLTLTTNLGGSTSVNVPAGQYMILYCDGTNVVNAVNAFGSLTTGALSASSATLTTALAEASGGTGQNTYTVGDLLYASGATALSKLADVVTGNALISGGVGVAPSWGKVGLTTHVSGTLPLANGGTGLATIPALSLFVANTLNTLSALTLTAGQSIRINAGGTAWEAYTSAAGDAVLANNNAFTGANTFYNSTGQTFGTATAAQDGIIIAGRAGGTSTYRVTLSPSTLTASRAVTFPDAAGNVVIDTATQTLSNKTLVAPALGTPASGVLTNCTGTAVGLTAGNLTQTTAGTAISVTTAAASSGTSGTISIQSGANSSGASGSIQIQPGSATSVVGDLQLYGGNASSGASGGAVVIRGGTGNGALTGGAVTITGGSAGVSSQGGDISITGGASASSDLVDRGGNVSITGGAATGNLAGSGNPGGSISITGGSSLVDNGGNVTITGGAVTSSASTLGGNIVITSGASQFGTGYVTIKTADSTATGSTGDINLEIGANTISPAVKGKINFVNCNVANGTVATTITSLGPTGSSTTIQGWLAVKINGTARYIPFW